MKPQHFDILGSLAFVYITGFAFYALINGGDVPFWSLILLAAVGLGGLIVDATIVFYYFIKKK